MWWGGGGGNVVLITVYFQLFFALGLGLFDLYCCSIIKKYKNIYFTFIYCYTVKTWVYTGITVNWKYLFPYGSKHGFENIGQYILCTDT